MPIVMGIVVLILLAVLGWAVYVIAQNSSGGEEPAPVPTTAATTARTLGTEPAPPIVEPTTTTPEPLPSTTDPTTTEVTVPALRGLPLADAQAALARVGLGARVIRRASDAPPGTVIDSDPAEGQEVPPDTRVTLVVAQVSTASPTATATTTPATGDGAD
jgi:beta-lactam-binding protein with PASTA domain